MEKELLLQVKNLQISWLLDKALIPIVCGLDFSLKSGKVLALVGESGCGKSVTSLSLLRLLAKELKIVGGEILFHGQNGEETLDMAKIDPRGKDIQKIRGGAVSMIFQEPMSSFSPLYTIGYQIMEVIQLHKDVSKKEAKRYTGCIHNAREKISPQLVRTEKIYKSLINPKEMKIRFKQPPEPVSFTSGKEPKRYLFGCVCYITHPKSYRITLFDHFVNKRIKVKVPLVVY